MGWVKCCMKSEERERGGLVILPKEFQGLKKDDRSRGYIYIYIYTHDATSTPAMCKVSVCPHDCKRAWVKGAGERKDDRVDLHQRCVAWELVFTSKSHSEHAGLC
jgi:hypothetical protein